MQACDVAALDDHHCVVSLLQAVHWSAALFALHERPLNRLCFLPMLPYYKVLLHALTSSAVGTTGDWDAAVGELLYGKHLHLDDTSLLQCHLLTCVAHA